MLRNCQSLPERIICERRNGDIDIVELALQIMLKLIVPGKYIRKFTSQFGRHMLWVHGSPNLSQETY